MEPVGRLSEASGIGPPDFKRVFTTESAVPKAWSTEGGEGFRQDSQDGQDGGEEGANYEWSEWREWGGGVYKLEVGGV